MIELWDAYDRNFRIIPEVILERGKMAEFPEGAYHMVVDVAVKHEDGTYLLMQRDHNKVIYPGKWEFSAGGAVISGENPLEAAKRELNEETGIAAEELTEIGRGVSERAHSVHICYLCNTDCSKDSIQLQESETIAYRWVDKNTLDEEVNDFSSVRTYRCLFE